ncbi:sulfur carrier protein ThiS [Rhizobium sp. NRK18]|uniref:sulfur carrier protein ThiS n=1 Tax=Rhizobium sp. NRK18 TaxID=2964667 RepID=UPI0021C2BEAC|nr:sulfur carrier protein ThiS [Rhizobium sp. NRK18]MCQ2005915.1 sulfur carrier protein ThiS [Rhizobium sp. NRK18]
MKLTINGEEQDVAAETLAALLSALDYEGDWLATAVNGELVPRSERDEHMLADGDRIEVLSPMQGG